MNKNRLKIIQASEAEKSGNIGEVLDENLTVGCGKGSLKIEKNENIIIDHDSGNILSEKDYVSMNFWLCKSNFFKHLEDYIAEQGSVEGDVEQVKMYGKILNLTK